jgi:hypothetical protein
MDLTSRACRSDLNCRHASLPQIGLQLPPAVGVSHDFHTIKKF